MLPNSEITKTLLEAYNPCQFLDNCVEAEWNPEGGFIPRGFLGATGELEEVEAVFVFAEPGHPMLDEHGEYSESLSAEEYIQLTTDFAYACFSREIDEMHVNVRYILNEIWPSLSFEEQLKKVWMTETRLCSIKKEIGNIPIRNRDICSSHYLKKQLNLFTNAKVIGFGNKAKDTLTRLGQDHLQAWAVSPPGANNQKAKDSWENVIHLMRNKDNVKVSINIESSGETVSNQDIVKAAKSFGFELKSTTQTVKPVHPPHPFGKQKFIEINYSGRKFGFSFHPNTAHITNIKLAQRVLLELGYKPEILTKSGYTLVMSDHIKIPSPSPSPSPSPLSPLGVAKAFKELVDKAGKCLVENEIWKSTFQQIILLVDKYADKGSSTSFIEENSLEVKIGNPPEYLVKVFIYDHPSLGIVLRNRFTRPDEGAVVKAGEEGIPMMTIDYETPEEADETLFSHLEMYLESIS